MEHTVLSQDGRELIVTGTMIAKFTARLKGDLRSAEHPASDSARLDVDRPAINRDEEKAASFFVTS